MGSTKCLDIETKKVVTRRVVKVVRYPDRVIKRVNDLGKTPRGEKSSDGLEFLNRHKQPFDWENDELNEKLPEGEEPIYPDILAEVPGLVLESDFDDANDVVMGVHSTPLRVIPDTENDAHDIRGITPPRPIRPPVQVEDVESDDEDDDDEVAPPN